MFHTTERLGAEESSSSGVVSTANSRSFHIRRGLSTQDRGPRGGIFSWTDTEEDVQFDTSDSDNNCEVLLAGRQYPSIQDFASAIPNQLLLGSLLEHLCFVYESDPTRSRMLFKVIGQRLAAMNLLSPLAISDEFSTVRLQHNRAFTELLHATSSSLFPQEHRYLNTEGQSLRHIENVTCFRCTQENTISSNGSSIVFEHSEEAEAKENQVALESLSVKPSTSKEEMGHAVCPKNVRNPQNFVPCVFLGKPRATVNKCPAAKWESSTLSLSQNRLELNNNSYIDMDTAEWSEKQAREVQFHLMLYIQMQLCERSLKDWIHERNLRTTEGLLMLVDPCESVDSEHALKILKKILEGVEYIHSRGIMHRDLKPRNIFLHGPECHVKIGDFGLACRNIIMDEHEQRPSSSQAGVNTDSAHTSGVGTFVYAGPEQLEGSHYDSKSDLYSIGVIAFELFQPFGTEMERVHTLGELRQGKIPNTLSKSWPLLAKYITLLTSTDPLVRPSASQLLQSDLFSANDMVIHSLKRKLDEQEEEIVQLRRQISELQISQNAIHSPENI
ncbi:eukaryotic translation initiation factor 2-alpha kinase 1-like [Sinocyclocheilus grahami]|uniref:eukaryotic translation initiation factor 2-alpha kinase 1-like n=1 Tax=Sinocyclocheilus grahami TaxID=75366 RepID=UPI0007AD2BAF|nr:PREDICTED: eukaryotic translation initiation factor 2-alpha kinase 1-like [Sinocyclocheilus grahami]